MIEVLEVIKDFVQRIRSFCNFTRIGIYFLFEVCSLMGCVC